jgi:flagellar biosynthesis GTPase FlhF
MQVHMSPLLALVCAFFAPSHSFAQGAALPAKVTLLTDIQLPVPFAVHDIIQPVKAGSEVQVITVAGDKIKIAHGIGEGFVQIAQTDFTERAKETAKNPPLSTTPTPTPTPRPQKSVSSTAWMTRDQYDKRQADLEAERKAEEARRQEVEQKRREEIERSREAKERAAQYAKAEEERKTREAELKKAEQKQAAAQEQALNAQVAALDAQILAARQTFYRLRGALIGPDAGVKSGPHGIRDMRERADMERELRVAQTLLKNLERARAQISRR